MDNKTRGAASLGAAAAVAIGILSPHGAGTSEWIDWRNVTAIMVGIMVYYGVKDLKS
jgi:Na+/H+ antiporter NhaD/arsenite permease-like protein